MNMLKYHHLFAERGEEEELEAPGEYWQDKDTASRVSSPHSEAINIPPSQIPKSISASNRSGSQTRRGQRVDGYLLKSEIAIVDRLKGKNTRRSEVSELIRIGLSVKLGKKQVDVILPPLLEATRAEHRGFFNRFLFLIAIIAYKVSQILFLQERTLALMLGSDEDTLHRIEREAEVSARVESTRRTPQVEEVIGKFKQQIESTK
jgi:hypothetical protein